MTKAENRAAAKAWHDQRERERRELARAAVVQADLAELDRLRSYLIKNRTAGHVSPLIEAIDDYVEQITGDRTKLHTPSHRCG